MARPLTVVETALYVDDLDRAEAFYREVLGLELRGREPTRHVFFHVGGRMLLLFSAEATLAGGLLPPHGARGPGHTALGISAESFDQWQQTLEGHGVAIEQIVDWPGGGRSLYFRDPSGNSLELITPGVWGTSEGW